MIYEITIEGERDKFECELTKENMFPNSKINFIIIIMIMITIKIASSSSACNMSKMRRKIETQLFSSG